MGVRMRRAIVDDLADITERFPGVSAVFNCTGLGALTLKGVEDKDVYPAKVSMIYPLFYTSLYSST